MMAYSRVGAYDDARRAMKKIVEFAKIFRTDNPLVDFGAKVYQPKEPINCTYDTWGAPAALIRGLFEYLYSAEGLRLLPHIPPTLTELEQRIPIRFGAKRLYLSTVGAGPVTSVLLNGKAWTKFDKESISLPYDETPDTAVIQIVLGDAKSKTAPEVPVRGKISGPAGSFAKFAAFYAALQGAGLEQTYEAQHAKLIVDYAAAMDAREKLKQEGKLTPLPEASQTAADKSYTDAANRLVDGLTKVVESYEKSDDPGKKNVFALWRQSASAP